MYTKNAIAIRNAIWSSAETAISVDCSCRTTITAQKRRISAKPRIVGFMSENSRFTRKAYPRLGSARGRRGGQAGSGLRADERHGRDRQALVAPRQPRRPVLLPARRHAGLHRPGLRDPGHVRG